MCFYQILVDPTLFLDDSSSLTITFTKMINLDVRIYEGVSRKEALKSIVPSNEMPKLS